MPWLPMYLNSDDKAFLIDWLNQENNIAEIVLNEDKRWIATDNITISLNKRYCFWHNQSGPLPLLRSNKNLFGKKKKDGLIKNPYDGWTEERTGANPLLPYFGAGHPGIFWLNFSEKKESITLSSFEWIGNHYSIIGSKAPEVTMKWWQRLRHFVMKNSIKIPRSGEIDGDHKEIWAFSGAIQDIKDGIMRNSNP